jgi:aerobic carbon-monoxide dehydrogenase large subunit
MIGDPVRRKEDDHLVTGRTTWTANVRPAGTLHLGFLRSPVAHGRLIRLDISRAVSQPGVVAVLTGEDLRLGERGFVGAMQGKRAPEHQPLAIDVVRYPGEPVAAVVARDAAAAADALSVIEVDYEPLPTVGDAAAALTSQVRVHNGIEGNICFTREKSAGDVAAAFAGADVVVRRQFSLARVAPAAMEPRSVVAAPDGDGYVVWTSTQTPQIIRYELARATGIPEAMLRVVAPDVGGGFGGKVCAYMEDFVVLQAARRLGRPVAWNATRSEDLATTCHGRVLVQDIAVAATAQGRLLGLDVGLLADVGAYVSPVGPGSAMGGGELYSGIYHFDAYALRATGVFTNRTPVGAYRGAGRPEAAFAIERILDELAVELDVDPIELRRRNWITEFPHTIVSGLTVDVGDYGAATDRALDLFDYDGLRADQQRRRAAGAIAQLGIGVSTYIEACGGGIKYSDDAQETASVRLLPTGGAEVTVGTTAFGTGHATSWSQLVADVLGVPFADIRVIHGDTASAPHGYGSYGSRSLVVGGAAVHAAAVRTRRKATELAAEMLEASAGDLELVDGVFGVKGTPSATVSLAAVALHSYQAGGGVEPGLGSVCGSDLNTETYPAGTHLAAVEVDTETGFVRVIRFVAVDDVGNVVNPLIVDGQIHGGVAQGIGEALFEEMAYDEDGNLVTAGFSELTIPAASDLPPFLTDRTCTPSPATPLGSKGVGEAGAIGSLPAIVNAVHDAVRHLGVRDLDVPCTPERVWRALHHETAAGK